MVDALDGGCKPAWLPSHPGYPTCPTDGCAGIDTDGDGFTDEAEILIGTDALGRCEAGSSAWPSSDWPADLAASGASADKITLQDVASFVAPAPKKLDTRPGDPGFNVRWDVVPGSAVLNWIVLQDLSALTAGDTAYPPMFSGVKAYDGPSCTAHPAYGD